MHLIAVFPTHFRVSDLIPPSDKTKDLFFFFQLSIFGLSHDEVNSSSFDKIYSVE